MDPAHKADMEKMAELARATLQSVRFETQLLPTNGQPLVFGRRVVDPAAPTVTVYNHMDVQPGGAARSGRPSRSSSPTEGDTGSGAGRPTTKAPA